MKMSLVDKKTSSFPAKGVVVPSGCNPLFSIFGRDTCRMEKDSTCTGNRHSTTPRSNSLVLATLFFSSLTPLSLVAPVSVFNYYGQNIKVTLSGSLSTNCHCFVIVVRMFEKVIIIIYIGTILCKLYFKYISYACRG